MTSFHPGDRVRVQSTGDDGFPLVRYGYVGTCGDDGEPVMVLLDDEFNGSTVVDRTALAPVTVTTVELCLDGADLLHDPSLRQGLVNLWSAEAEAAGLEIGALHHIGTGLRDSSESYVLAELTAGGEQYVLRAVCHPNDSDIVRVRADRPNRWDV
ncbi:MAG: hypothetical protein EA389_06395 [Ilumatobacter sp.]|nr:MAG: hypothetical protein EA389_06395 [Ilumatobacter sp.]